MDPQPPQPPTQRPSLHTRFVPRTKDYQWLSRLQVAHSAGTPTRILAAALYLLFLGLVVGNTLRVTSLNTGVLIGFALAAVLPPLLVLGAVWLHIQSAGRTQELVDNAGEREFLAWPEGFVLLVAQGRIQHPWRAVQDILVQDGRALLVLRRNSKGIGGILLAEGEAVVPGQGPVPFDEAVAIVQRLWKAPRPSLADEANGPGAPAAQPNVHGYS